MGQPPVAEVEHPASPAAVAAPAGPPVVLAAPAVVVTVLALDLVMGGDVGLMFGLGFVTGCVWLGLCAPRSQFYLAALLPPALMLALMLLVGIADPAAVGEPGAGAVQGVVAGFAHHSWALGLGYLLCLGALGARLSR